MEPCAAAPFGSRTILNALRVALGIFSGKIILYLRLSRPVGRSKRIFTGWGRTGKLHLFRQDGG